MAKKIVSFENLLPAAVIASGINEETDINKIKEALASRTIVSADRFLLKPGDYHVTGVRAATWMIGSGKSKKEAVMCLLTVEDSEGNEHSTTIGSLRKIDATLKNYGPADLPVNEADLLDMLMSNGIVVSKIVETKATVFAPDGSGRIADPEDPTGYKTKPTKLMAWSFGEEKPAASKRK